LTSSGEGPNAFSIFFQGDAPIAPAVFGDGLRCAGGSLYRLYMQSASGGIASAPQPGDASVSSRSAASGDPLSVAATRFYQVQYRDSNLAFCPSPAGDAWNVSSALRIAWLP
jgi:hypothetical protein